MGMLVVTVYICLFATCKSIIYQEGFPPARITIVGTPFDKHLSLQIIIFLIKMAPVHKVWSWSLWGQRVILTTCQPCLSLDPPPHSLHPFQLFGRPSRLKTQNYGGSKSKVSKNIAKVQYFEADLRLPWGDHGECDYHWQMWLTKKNLTNSRGCD